MVIYKMLVGYRSRTYFEQKRQIELLAVGALVFFRCYSRQQSLAIRFRCGALRNIDPAFNSPLGLFRFFVVVVAGAAGDSLA